MKVFVLLAQMVRMTYSIVRLRPEAAIAQADAPLPRESALPKASLVHSPDVASDHLSPLLPKKSYPHLKRENYFCPGTQEDNSAGPVRGSHRH